ncbi:DedA family protein [Auraticoccus monumenti]|uniref:Membrane protein DedA, SNARE-associated domain n=1 Tax=Auraticoccus monumenti TaxID=675864 RepID=A0A1G6RQ76_9ACTN|nr:VTT domain-containing protein [Auraticoccus monumenti]SDD06769.1 membrane protein DedA, SNARE-associated domain [Auraticoccus monumenti]
MDPHTETSAPNPSPEEPKAPASMRDLVPWEGRATRGDKLLVGAVLGGLALMIATIPVRPFLLASHPVLLEFVTGSLSAVGAGAAFARIGEVPLWLVVVAGVVGTIKLDWLFWLAGRRWGGRIVSLFAPSEQARRLVTRLRGANPWVVRLATAAASLPGVPSALVFAVAGLHRMRLSTFLLFDALGASLMVGLVAGLGYGLGQHAVDVVLLVDEYALWVSLALIVGLAFWSARKSARAASAKQPPQDRGPH